MDWRFGRFTARRSCCLLSEGKEHYNLCIDFYGIQVIFLLGSFFRFTAFLLLKRVQTTKIKTVPQVFFNVMSTVGRRMATRPYEFPMLQLRPKKRRPEDEPLKLDLPASLEDTSDIEENTSEEPKTALTRKRDQTPKRYLQVRTAVCGDPSIFLPLREAHREFPTLQAYLYESPLFCLHFLWWKACERS